MAKVKNEVATTNDQATTEFQKDNSKIVHELEVARGSEDPSNWETLTGTKFLKFMDVEAGTTDVYALSMGEAPGHDDRDTLTPCAILTDMKGEDFFCRDAVVMSTAEKVITPDAPICVVRITMNGKRKGSKGEYADLTIQRYKAL